MPKVTNVPTTSLTGLPSARQSAGGLGPDASIAYREQNAEALFRAGNALAKQLSEQAAEYNEASVKTLDVEYSDRLSQIISEYAALSGKGAIDAQAETRQRITELNAEYSGRAENEAQRQMWERVSAARTSSTLSQINTHASRELRTFSENAADARAKLQGQQAIRFRDDDKQRKAAIAAGVAEVEERARIRGETSPEQLDLLRKSYTTTVTAEIVKSYVTEGRAGAAKAYLDAHSGDVLPDQLDDMRRQVEQAAEADNAVTVQRALETLPGGFKDKYRQLGEAFDKKGAIAGVRIDGALYQHVKAGLEHAERQREAEANKYEASVLGRAQEWIIQNPGRPVTELPRELYLAARNKGHLAALDSLAGRSGKAEDNYAAVVRRGELLRLSAENVKAFLSMPMEREMALGVRGIREMQDLQAKLRDGKVTDFATAEKQISVTARQLGFAPSSEKAAVFAAAAYDALRDELAASGKPSLNEVERQRVIDRLVIEGKRSGSWFGTRFYNVRDTPDAATFSPKIPPTDAKLIEDALRAKMGRGFTPLPGDVEVVYKAQKKLPLTAAQKARLNLLRRGQ